MRICARFGRNWRKSSLSKRGSLPFVFLNAAISADGKLALPNRKFEPFGSKRDRELMLQLRAQADAVLAGTSTADQPGVTFSSGGRKYQQLRARNNVSSHLLRVIVSGSGSLRPQADLFKKHDSPVIVLTTERAPKAKLARLREVADEVAVFGETDLCFTEAFKWLRAKHNVRRLLSEGGGGVNAALFAEGLVNEVHLTICPCIFGGRDSPTLADGQGVERLADATQLRLKRFEQVNHEMFAVYSVKKTK